MPIDVLMPQLSPTMTEGRLATWNVKEGDTVAAGDVIAEVETDKATMEVEATDDGVVHVILGEPGSDIKVGVPIAVLKEDGEDVPDDYKPEAVASSEAAPAEEESAESSESSAPTPAAPTPMAAPTPAPTTPSVTPAQTGIQNNGPVKASPLAKRLAKEKGLDLSMIQGSGPHGRIVKADVLNAPAGGAGARAIVRRPDQTVKNSPMRKSIAQRLTQSKQWVPHFYLNADVKMDSLLDLRQQVNAAAPTNEEGKPAYKISVNDLILKASAMALAKNPDANASWNEEEVIVYGNVDISVAVSIEGGLITPIVTNADQKGIIQLSNEMKQLAGRARKGELKPEEYQGGSFSLSNLGMYGTQSFSAIINPPQAAILAVGAANPRAVVHANGDIGKASIMSMTMSVDHRVIDGALGAELLADIKFFLENPAAMLV